MRDSEAGVLGDKKVIIVKLHTLHHDFETPTMKANILVQTFLSKVFGIVNIMKLCRKMSIMKLLFVRF